MKDASTAMCSAIKQPLCQYISLYGGQPGGKGIFKAVYTCNLAVMTHLTLKPVVVEVKMDNKGG